MALIGAQESGFIPQNIILNCLVLITLLFILATPIFNKCTFKSLINFPFPKAQQRKEK